MKIGISLADFSWPVPVTELGSQVTGIARAADEAGVDSLWVMDHFFQIRLTGHPPESPMPEAYALLGVLAGQMYLGIGAGAPFNPPPQGPGTAFEGEGLGIPFPPLADRFEMLEEALQIAHRMW